MNLIRLRSVFIYLNLWHTTTDYTIWLPGRKGSALLSELEDNRSYKGNIFSVVMLVVLIYLFIYVLPKNLLLKVFLIMSLKEFCGWIYNTGNEIFQHSTYEGPCFSILKCCSVWLTVTQASDGCLVLENEVIPGCCWLAKLTVPQASHRIMVWRLEISRITMQSQQTHKENPWGELVLPSLGRSAHCTSMRGVFHLKAPAPSIKKLECYAGTQLYNNLYNRRKCWESRVCLALVEDGGMDLINACKYLRGVRKMESDSSVVPSDRTRFNGHKLEHSEFYPPWEGTSTLRAAEHWNRLCEVVESLQTFKAYLDTFLCDLL